MSSLNVFDQLDELEELERIPEVPCRGPTARSSGLNHPFLDAISHAPSNDEESNPLTSNGAYGRAPPSHSLDRRPSLLAGADRLTLPRPLPAGGDGMRGSATLPRLVSVSGQDQTPPHELSSAGKAPLRFNQLPTHRSSSPPAPSSSSPALNASIRRSSDTRSIRAASNVPSYHQQRQQIDLKHAPPMIQGIPLVPLTDLPDRFRTLFSFDMFNAIQSKCFRSVFKTDDNMVLSSPTGSGKTVIFELAICRLMSTHPSGEYKIVYQAPTKSLCAERTRDWTRKLQPLGLTCAEMTGDSDNAQLRGVQNANVIITTPEKWDSMTRKWKDHEKLMRLVKLFLIDEVHILKEDRGATLEAVVSRMKSIGSGVRFIALSATVPNSSDVAAWLGKDGSNPGWPAICERFGDDFRPVKLQKHVVGFQSKSNDFAFEKLLTSKLPEVIAKFSQRRPIMVFCFMRKSTVETAKRLSTWWMGADRNNRYWEAPRQTIAVGDGELRSCVTAGVAFHHAGVDPRDKEAIEAGFLRGDVNVICCTSTLAVGVNLPCHMVIVKNTITWQGTNGCKEYTDLEVIQMLGRAGRPQFDSSAVAVIMTKQEKAKHYDQMVSGKEVLESCLHLNLIDHLNSEIGLGTIVDLPSAQRWLESTFLHVRLKQNPNHYQLGGGVSTSDIDELLQRICSRNISLLQDLELITASPPLTSTEFGDAMARYYVQFETMTTILSVPEKPRTSDLLAAIAQASEFKDIRFRSGDKTVYKKANDPTLVRFPISVDLAQPAHKVSLIIQIVLGGHEKTLQDHQGAMQFNIETSTIFQHAARLIRCIIDCQLYLNDSIGVRNALALCRSLAAKAWEDSPLQLKQIEGIGPVAAHKLAQAGIKSIEMLEYEQPARIEMVLSKNPPWGHSLMEKLKTFPKLRVSLQMKGYTQGRPEDGVHVNVKAEIGFLNEKPPLLWQKKRVYVCFLAETSDGQKVHFCRIGAAQLGSGQDVFFTATLVAPGQVIACYVMCDDIAGTLQHALLTPNIPRSRFPRPSAPQPQPLVQEPMPPTISAAPSGNRRFRTDSSDSDYGLADIADADLLKLDPPEDAEFLDIDEVEQTAPGAQPSANRGHRDIPVRAGPSTDWLRAGGSLNDEWRPQRRPNGKFECNHTCKDKKSCKHLCCREGVDKPRNPPKKAGAAENARKSSAPGQARNQTTLDCLPVGNRNHGKAGPLIPAKRVLEIDLTQDSPDGRGETTDRPQGLSKFRRNPPELSGLASTGPREKGRVLLKTRPAHQYSSARLPELSFMHGDNQDVSDPIEDISTQNWSRIPDHDVQPHSPDQPSLPSKVDQYGRLHLDEAELSLSSNIEAAGDDTGPIALEHEDPTYRAGIASAPVDNMISKGTNDTLPDLAVSQVQLSASTQPRPDQGSAPTTKFIFVSGVSNEARATSPGVSPESSGREQDPAAAFGSSPYFRGPNKSNGAISSDTTDSRTDEGLENYSNPPADHPRAPLRPNRQVRQAAWVHDKPEHAVTEDEVNSVEWFLGKFGHCVELVDSNGNVFDSGE